MAEDIDADNRYRSRKFLFAAFFSAMGTIGLFTSHLSGGEWIGLAGVVLGLYGAANVWEKK